MRTLVLCLTLALAGCSSDPESPADAGPTSVDSGPARRDAGRPDAAVAPADAGPLPDAAFAPADAGPLPDGGQPGDADAGVLPPPCSEVGAAADDLASYQAILECLRHPDEPGTAKQEAIRLFVSAVEARGGFPIHSGDDAVFVYVRDAELDAEDDKTHADEDFAPERRAEPLRVAGAFSGWSPSITLAGEGQGFFHARAALPGSAGQRWGYKLVAKDGSGADVWFSDPLSRRFDYDGNGRISLVRGGDDQGHLEWIRRVRATALGNDRPIYLYLPRGYETGTQTYPVLYMHDGNNLFDPAQPGSNSSWQADAVAEAEIAAGRARPFLLVGVPNNADRMNEYTHTTDTAFGQVTGGKGDLYASFLVEDLKPLIDARYRTRPDFANTAILGSSLGGLISFYVAHRHPTVFKYVGGMSSTFDWGQPGKPTVGELMAQVADLKGRGQVYYLDSGGHFPAGGCRYDGEDDDGDNLCCTLQLKDTLVAKGIDTFPDDPTAFPLQPAGIDIVHYWEPDAVHNEAAWNGRLFMALRLFFQP